MKLEEEVMMMMMMMIPKTPEHNLRLDSFTNDPTSSSSSSSSPTFPTWKLYENPFYTNSTYQTQDRQKQRQCEGNESNVIDDQIHQPKQIHRLQLPISTRKIAASFWDLTFIKPFMESDLELARAKIMELKAEVERERKARKKTESMNKKLARELSEAKKGRESMERLCEELAREISSEKAEMDRMHKNMEEERKMLRVAEVLREERVQMKLADAKLLLEEKLQELQMESKGEKPEFGTNNPPKHHHSSNSNDNTDTNTSLQLPRRASSPVPEAENPHIKRGIKGFVEFPKVVRAIGSKSRHLGTKLECQKAQLRILLKHSPVRSSNLITN